MPQFFYNRNITFPQFSKSVLVPTGRYRSLDFVIWRRKIISGQVTHRMNSSMKKLLSEEVWQEVQRITWASMWMFKLERWYIVLSDLLTNHCSALVVHFSHQLLPFSSQHACMQHVREFEFMCRNVRDNLQDNDKNLVIFRKQIYACHLLARGTDCLAFPLNVEKLKSKRLSVNILPIQLIK